MQGSFAEAGTDRAHVAAELAAELRQVAGWLGLGDVIQPPDDLSGELQAAV